MSDGEKNLVPSEDLVFDWIQIRKDIGIQEETSSNKFIRKFKETPAVPIGVLATTLCLGYGLWSMRKGRSRMSQLMMRGRILAQGFTIAALVAGLGYSAVDN